MHQTHSFDGLVDISETSFWELFPEELNALLKDRTTQKNIFWATDSYAYLGKGFQYKDNITVAHITGAECGRIVRPRSVKEKEDQVKRIRSMAEVFTPSWICNAQNNLIDYAWFGRENVFNEEFIDEQGVHCWKTNEAKIVFPAKTGKKAWQAYVRDIRLEITCGEGPYVVSRYDTVSGELIPLSQRVGFLDRKLRVVCENTRTKKDWLSMAKDAIKSSYGFEWQGDNLLLARESVFFSFIEYYQAHFNEAPPMEDLHEVAEIVSWNFWQMDGLKMVVPDSCEEKYIETLFDGPVKQKCDACVKGEMKGHIGDHCVIMDWFSKDGPVPIQFQELMSSR